MISKPQPESRIFPGRFGYNAGIASIRFSVLHLSRNNRLRENFTQLSQQKPS
jgi:hypothetical protein